MKKRISILINCLIIVLEIVGFIYTYSFNHRIAIEYYTEDSNIFALFVTLLFLIFILFNKTIPSWLKIFKYSMTICLSVTFFVVIFILAPMYKFNYGYLLFHNELLYHHLLCPVLSIITFIFFDDLGKITLKDCFKGLITTFIYAFILITLNILNIIEGPYPFLMVYKQSIVASIIWFILIIGFAYFIAYMLKKLYTKFNIK